MTKKRINRVNYRFESEERLLDRRSKVKLVGDGVFGDVSLNVLSNLLDGVELQGVRRQIDQFETALVGLDVGLVDGLDLMDAVAEHDQMDWPCDCQHVFLQETLEDLCFDQILMEREPHGEDQADGRDFLDHGLHACVALDVSLARESLGGAAMIVLALGCLVATEYTSTIELGTRHHLGQILCAPIGVEQRVLLLCLVQVVLRTEAQRVCHLADNGNVKLKLALDERGDKAQLLQSEIERELVGVMREYQKVQAAQLHCVEFGWASLDLLGHQSILAIVDEGHRLLQHRAWHDFENCRNVCRQNPPSVYFHRLLSSL